MWAIDLIARAVLGGTEELVVLVDREHKMLFVNRTPPGTDQSKYLGTRLYDHDPGARDLIVDCFERAFETGEAGFVEVPRVLQGHLRHWQARVSPIVEDGVVRYLAVYARDATAERDKELEKESFFRLSSDLLCTTSLRGELRAVSPSFTEILGYEAEELIHRSFLDLLVADDRPTLAGAAQQLKDRHRVSNYECRLYSKSGAIRLVQWSGVFEPKSRQVYAVGRDVTDTRKLEEQLLQSQKLEAVGQLAGGIAHDFNNIILAVTLNAELADGSTQQEDVRDFLREILKASSRANALTKQLLAFSKSEVVEPRVLDLRELVESVFSMVRRVIPESIDVHTSLGEDLLPVEVDRGQIEQVLLNLCLNARDAMPQGKGKLDLSLAAAPGPDGRQGVLLSVKDTGCGIPLSIQGRILEPFFTTKERGTGTGLGLTSVYTVLTRHGGVLDINSEPGMGTEMRVWLPASVKSVIADVSALSGARSVLFGGQTVLVAEDDAQVRTAVVAALQNAGLKVFVAEDGEEAMAMALQGERRFDLAILDLVMPRASGHEVFVHLRSLDRELPVIFATGYFDGQLSDEILGLQSVLLLCKPYRPAELLQATAHFLSPHSPGPAESDVSTGI